MIQPKWQANAWKFWSNKTGGLNGMIVVAALVGRNTLILFRLEKSLGVDAIIPCIMSLI